MPSPAKRQIPRQSVRPDRDLSRLTAYLTSRRIARMLDGISPGHFTTGEINRVLFPWYDKSRTYRKEASPGLLLLRMAMEREWVRYGSRHGTWVDVRDRATIAEAVGMQRGVDGVGSSKESVVRHGYGSLRGR